MTSSADDGLEWWEMPESTIRWLEEDRIRRAAAYAVKHERYLQRERIRTQARRKLPEIAERDGFYCQTCGTTHRLTVDHKIPLARGGTNDLENLQLLCWSCNSRKAAK